jgi:DNA-binding response OmpR family regulator
MTTPDVLRKEHGEIHRRARREAFLDAAAWHQGKLAVTEDLAVAEMHRKAVAYFNWVADIDTGERVTLSPREYAVWERLRDSRGNAVRMGSLIWAVWGEHDRSEAEMVHHLKQYIMRIRKKLGFPAIRTVKGIGYAANMDASIPPLIIRDRFGD